MMFEMFQMEDYILLGLFFSSCLVLLYYYWGIFGAMAFFKEGLKPAKPNEEAVSVIIAARNEFANLQKNLPKILNQDYPNFEVIVVNDCSWDDSQPWLEELQKTEPRLRLSQLIEQEKYPTGKKFALTIGIKAAKNNLLLFTDADCEPATNQWIRQMQSQFTNNKQIVLGISPYVKKPGLLNRFIRFESLLTAQFYIGAALKNNAFMGVGRNLAYSKDLFFKHKGFASHQHIKSGDDDLFVNQAATASNVSIQLAQSSFVNTEPKLTYASWSAQKLRHLTTGKLYKSKHKKMLGMYYAAMFVFYTSLITGLILNIMLWPWYLIAFGIKLISQTIITYFCGKHLKYQSLAFAVMLLDALYLLYIVFFGLRSLFIKNTKKW